MQTPTFKLYPARAGLIVRDPRTRKPLSESGETKPKNGYWLRRLREGSVTKMPLASAKVSAGGESAAAGDNGQENAVAEKPVKQAKPAKPAAADVKPDGADND